MKATGPAYAGTKSGAEEAETLRQMWRVMQAGSELSGGLAPLDDMMKQFNLTKLLCGVGDG
jgi:hypothetical protein